MKTVFFYPRVGKNYFTKGLQGKKVLILGESHYCEDQCKDCGNLNNSRCNHFTENVFKRYFDYKKGNGEFEGWMNTYTKFANIMHYENLNSDNLFDFWDSVVFYNYVQSAIEEARVSPTKEQFDNSLDAFFEVLEEYMPDIIIVWGERLWNNLPVNGKIGEDILVDNKSNGSFYDFNVQDKIIHSYGIYHPSSSAFSYEWHKYLKAAIDKIL